MIFFVVTTSAGTLAALWKAAMGQWAEAATIGVTTLGMVGIGLLSVWREERDKRIERLDERRRRLIR